MNKQAFLFFKYSNKKWKHDTIGLVNSWGSQMVKVVGHQSLWVKAKQSSTLSKLLEGPVYCSIVNSDNNSTYTLSRHFD